MRNSRILAKLNISDDVDMGKQMKAFQFKKKLEDLQTKITASFSPNDQVLDLATEDEMEAQVMNANISHSNVKNNRDRA